MSAMEINLAKIREAWIKEQSTPVDLQEEDLTNFSGLVHNALTDAIKSISPYNSPDLAVGTHGKRSRQATRDAVRSIICGERTRSNQRYSIEDRLASNPEKSISFDLNIIIDLSDAPLNENRGQLLTTLKRIFSLISHLNPEMTVEETRVDLIFNLVLLIPISQGVKELTFHNISNDKLAETYFRHHSGPHQPSESINAQIHEGVSKSEALQVISSAVSETNNNARSLTIICAPQESERLLRTVGIGNTSRVQILNTDQNLQ